MNNSPALSRSSCVSSRPAPAARLRIAPCDNDVVRDRGGAFSLGRDGKLRDVSHAVKQPNAPRLSENTETRHVSRGEELCACLAIPLFVALGVFAPFIAEALS